MKVNGFVIGRQENSWKAYVKKRFRYRDRIDKRAVMIVCAGCTVKQKELLETEIRKYVDFDNVIFKKASSTISCNSGEGSFGIFYVIKDKRGNY
jgi:fatty acid-binding protein DegV